MCVIFIYLHIHRYIYEYLNINIYIYIYTCWLKTMVILMCRHSLIETFSHETRVKKVPRSKQFYMLCFSYRIHIYQPMMLMPTDSLTGAWFVLSGHELLWSSMFAHQREQRVLQNVLYYRYLIIWVCFLASPVNLCFLHVPRIPCLICALESWCSHGWIFMRTF